MTATDEQYVPSEDEMVSGLVQIPGEPAGIYRHVRVDEMKRGLARVRRDAAREALAAAEHRATRAEAQSAIRGRAVVIYRERAQQAEAERDWSIRSSRSSKKGRIEANARADRAEAERDEWRQTALDERGAALDALEQIKARDARIQAVQDLIDQADTAGDWTVTCTRLQSAIDNPNPYEETP